MVFKSRPARAKGITRRDVVLLICLAVFLSIYYYTRWDWMVFIVLAVNCLLRFKKRPIVQNVSDCEVELADKFFTYRSLESNYCVDVSYDRIQKVSLVDCCGKPNVQVSIDSQAELGCANIPNAEELAEALKVRAGLC